ncbi:phage tail sheath family protein [Streptomyces noursei]|uniref:phage tail sheath family protein n=1 Tax=Streptomyces noursei TaxID=1971 RepID=UPI0015E12D3E|nr:phage tail sheath subtilisin-like domain-containing protein [Streptomyces noursei]
MSEPTSTHPIAGAGTSTPAFIGPVAGLREPTLIQDWPDFSVRLRPKAAASSHLPDAVRAYFENGGGACYLIPVDGLGYGTGLVALEAIDVQMVVAPDLWSGTGEDAFGIAQAVAGHCVKMGNRMAILHTPGGFNPQQAIDFPKTLGFDEPARQFTAVYHPWVIVPRNDGESALVPPSGHVAGVWARVAVTRGIHYAPTDQPLKGITGLQHALTDRQSERMRAAGVNCVLPAPGQTLRVWGARTLSAETNWKHINVRRLVNYLGESIRQSANWAAFEPDIESLWAALRYNVSSFLTGQWHQGTLLGLTADEAFYVICDATNNPVNNGHIICDIGVAPVRPAEFVHFTITQTVGDRLQRIDDL